MPKTMAWRIGTEDSGGCRPRRRTRRGAPASEPRSAHRRRWRDTGTPAPWRVVVMALHGSITQRGEKSGGCAVERRHLAVGRAQRVGHMSIGATAHGEAGLQGDVVGLAVEVVE